MHKKAMHNVTSDSEKILIRRAIFKTSLAINGKNRTQQSRYHYY